MLKPTNLPIWPSPYAKLSAAPLQRREADTKLLGGIVDGHAAVQRGEVREAELIPRLLTQVKKA